jgi:prepilin signal peptidase PulO-like enzyme (type II secretory pathway)
LTLQYKVLSNSLAANPRGGSLITAHQINRLSARVTIVLSLLALLTVLSGYTHPPQPTEPDEGAAAHIFQLSIVAVAFSILVFLTTADWKQPLRSVRPLAFPTTALVLAFGALYYLEHIRFVAAH